MKFRKLCFIMLILVTLVFTLQDVAAQKIDYGDAHIYLDGSTRRIPIGAST